VTADGSIDCQKDPGEQESTLSSVRFEAFAAVTMKNVVFWDVALCRTWVNRRFGGTYCLHLQGGIIREQWTSVNSWLQTEPLIGATSCIRDGERRSVATYCEVVSALHIRRQFITENVHNIWAWDRVTHVPAVLFVHERAGMQTSH
jgi:hypothetical protein